MSNILFIIKDLYGGGAEKSLINTAEGLRVRGNEVTVFILRDRIEHRIPEHLNIINLKLENKFTKMFSNFLTEKIQAFFIKKEIEKLNPDLVISCACDKITRHIDHKNIWYWIKNNGLASRKTEQAKNKFKEKLLKFYNNKNIISVSKGVTDTLLNEVGLKPKKILSIYNPYDKKLFVTMAQEHEQEIPNGEYFLSVGVFEKRKRHDRLLRAYKMSGIQTPLYLLGKGNEEDYIKKMISELGLENRVFILGYKKNPYPFIKNAKALVMTSDAEGLPRVLIEALFLDTPVISVDCPSGPKEILTGALAEFLVPLKDDLALANAIKKMDLNPIEINPLCYQQFLSENVLPLFEKLANKTDIS